MAERCYTGTLTFDKPIPTHTIPEQYALLQAFDLFTITTEPTPQGPALTGLNLDDYNGDGVAKTLMWASAFALMQDLARTHRRTLTANNMTWKDDTHDSGTSIVDAKGLIHDIPNDTIDTLDHYNHRCSCLPTPEPDNCIHGNQIPPNPHVRTHPHPAAPSTHWVVCDEHGEICPATTDLQTANHHREEHLLLEHTPHPLPLFGTQLAAALLPHVADAFVSAFADTLTPETTNAVALAADHLRKARSRTYPNPLQLRSQAQTHARAACETLRSTHPNAPSPQKLVLLLHHMIETQAQTH